MPDINVIRRIFCVVALAVCTSVSSAQPAPRQSQPAAQQSTDKSAARSVEKAQETRQQEENAKDKSAPKLPAQIELLETHVRFETNGNSRKEVYARVHINDELGARQFARLNFGYNRAFQSVEIPLAHITHANGGTSDVLPSAITDNPDPAVVNFPAYQDVRVKSIRILGLAPDDILEYRVIATTSHHPLAPDVWFEHTFDRSGVVDHETFALDLPVSRLKDAPELRRIELQINPDTPAEISEAKDADGSERRNYRWKVSHPGSASKASAAANADEYRKPDIALSSYIVWGVFVETFARIFRDGARADATVAAKAATLTKGLNTPQEKLAVLYDFVSQKIATVDLPPGATGFRTRLPADSLSSGYAAPVDKFLLFAALASAEQIELSPALTRVDPDLPKELPSPSLFTQILATWGPVWLDPDLEIAPFGLVTPALHGKPALWVRKLPDCGPTADCGVNLWTTVPTDPAIPSFQKVYVAAAISPDGALSAKVKYTLRGDNELLLRLAFHQAPKEKWNEVAQLLALSDGFRGKISEVSASDRYATKEPFSVQFEITQPKFLDWVKKPLRIPAILPVLGLPDPPAKSSPGTSAPPIELGTPLDVEVTATVKLPEGTGAEVPAGTSIERDFATYESHYAVSNGTLTASRHINFILKQMPADRSAEYNAFLHAVQNDESQLFTLQPPAGLSTKPASPEQKQPPPKPKQ